MVELAASVAKFVWREHFHIPEVAYWGVAFAGAVLFPFVSGIATGLAVFLFGLGVTGIARWHWDRSRARGGLVVAYMRTSARTAERAEEVQRDTVSSVIDQLPAELARHVHRVPAVVGPEDRPFARRLQRRLRARFLLYGRIADDPSGAWSVYPRVLEPATGGPVLHLDPHTREVTFERKGREPLSSKLPATVRVSDEEYPHQFARDLAAVLRATVGQLQLERTDADDKASAARAEKLLNEALSIAGDSTSAQVDRLRVDLANALHGQDRDTEGREILRARVDGPSPSPELLRAYAFTSHSFGDDEVADGDWEAGTKALERALGAEEDPFWWDLTLYNLINRLLGNPEREDEAFERVDDFRTPLYRDRWDVQRLLGVRCWREAERLRDQRQLDAAADMAAQAARYYARAIRRRWRPYPVLGAKSPFVFPPSRRASPILHANLVDARLLAGHHYRAEWNERRFVRLRKRYAKRAFKALERFDLGIRVDLELQGNDKDASDLRELVDLDDGSNARLLARANAYLDWSIVGRRDNIEAVISVWRIVVLRLMGDAPSADVEWQRAKERNPFAIYARAYIWDNGGGLVRRVGMPGNEPLDVESAVEQYKADVGTEGPPLEALFMPMPYLDDEELGAAQPVADG